MEGSGAETRPEVPARAPSGHLRRPGARVHVPTPCESRAQEMRPVPGPHAALRRLHTGRR